MRDDVLDECERYRVRLVLDESPLNPREEFDYHASHLVTWGEHGRGLYEGLRGNVSDAGPLVHTYREFMRRNERQFFQSCDAAAMFARYVQMFHGGQAMVDGADVWYVLPGDIWSGRSNPAAQEYQDTMRKVIEAERNEYRAWESGEVYGYVIEEQVTWAPVDRIEYDTTMTTWEHVDSCYGYYGYEDAEGQAREAYAAVLSLAGLVAA